MVTMTNKQENEKTKQEVIDLFELEKKYKDIKKQYETKKSKLSLSIKNFMFANNWNTFSFKALTGSFSKNPESLDIKRVTRKKIIWNPEKIEEKLDKEMANEVLKKTYIIDNMPELVKYLKKCGVDPKKFKTFISVQKTIDKTRLDFLFETGEIKVKDLEGCYTVDESESYLKINVLKEE